MYDETYCEQAVESREIEGIGETLWQITVLLIVSASKFKGILPVLTPRELAC